MKSLSRNWKIFLLLSFLAGFLLRTLYVQDMEYKEDEAYNYTQSQVIGVTQGWPTYGIASGVYIVNPGASIWVFAALAKITGSKTPTELCRSVQLFALLGISLLIPFALLWIKDPREREPWLWAFALAMVNPLAILYQRKLWPEPFLPFFSMLILMSWYKRDRKLGAFVWGLVGAFIGQIHMSGFFYTASLFLWTAVFRQRENSTTKKSTQWTAWFAGSVIGALPLIPWATYILAHPSGTPIEHNWNEASQFKYWVFWISDAFGLHLGNTLGIYIGDSQLEQLSDFVRYPLIGGHATYLVGLAHVTTLVCMIWTALKLARWASNEVHAGWKSFRKDLIGRDSEAQFARNSALLGSGVLMTLTNVNIRRYYMMVTFPFEQFWISKFALSSANAKRGRQILALLWISQLFISANFVGYIHVNHGSPQGDYGDSYFSALQKGTQKK
jgi:hypothetical protein